ncbi:DUF302 domain-containing protein [Rhizobium sp. YS-1r]|jgi:uncharacterized protein (DUF302 family)|uniref:DUF302 domain-containing protein n=1 Tax=Rhizobium sp. YS-1r TaxID=1532558 RepID=UPI00050FD786|nr:DUF302 domain-containing protein [Rhizobium sp. YS-1r]KGD96634.1 hypothetical protein JL39_18790 [Rhizobium sp. YS-1r]
MAYTLDKTIDGSTFNEVVERTKAALSNNGFGVLTEIDVKATMKKKLNTDLDDYLILGACNPGMAFEAIKMEPKVGAMLPCNVIIRSLGEEGVMVSAIDPVASMQAIDNDALKETAGKVRGMLAVVVQAI